MNSSLTITEMRKRVCRVVGYPRSIRVDQGSEFISRDLDLWAYQRGVILDFSRPGKPTDNSFIESFNGKLRAECLNTHWFMSLDDARAKLEDWRRDLYEIAVVKTWFFLVSSAVGIRAFGFGGVISASTCIRSG